MTRVELVEMILEFQPQIAGPPQSPKELHKQACSSDEITIESWRDIWVNQAKKNKEKFGSFTQNGVGKLYQKYLHKPVIVVGSGPSLKKNVDALKDTKGIPVISCLHNYQFLEDRGITPDYYVTLDAGRVTVDEVSEGGAKTHEEYFESTKDKKLLAFISSHPDLVNQWKGAISWFNAPIPDQGIVDAFTAIEPFHTYVSTGGNVLGASFYLAKAIMGANPIIFVGADYSFSYTHKFHGWDSKYDKDLGNVLLMTDVFGNRVKTWGSYANFKAWTESVCCSVPGIYINSTEGGILGAYPNGNIKQIQQIALSDVIKMYSLSELVKSQCEAPETKQQNVLF